jgi:hypothetical protein
MIRSASIAALIASACTFVCVGLILAAQITDELSGESATDYSIGSIFAKLTNQGAVYTTASEPVRVSLLQPLLDLPVVIPLSAAAALLVALYLWLRRIEISRVIERGL